MALASSLLLSDAQISYQLIQTSRAKEHVGRLGPLFASTPLGSLASPPNCKPIVQASSLRTNLFNPIELMFQETKLPTVWTGI